MPESIPVTLYHNPSCGTSAKVLALIRNAGVDPTVIDYLRTPPERATLQLLIERMGIRPRDSMRCFDVSRRRRPCIVTRSENPTLGQ